MEMEDLQVLGIIHFVLEAGREVRITLHCILLEVMFLRGRLGVFWLGRRGGELAITTRWRHVPHNSQLVTITRAP